MTANKTIACLANSRKMSGRCVAGREILDGEPAGWIRPVSARPHHEVSALERNYQDGTDPAILDVVTIPLLNAQPADYQQENWLLDPKYYWQKTGQLSWSDLSSFEDASSPIWVDGHSSYHGINDEIPLVLANQLTSSLCFLSVPEVELIVHAPGTAFGDAKRKMRAQFTYEGSTYNLRVTDPHYENRYFAEPNGTYALGECFLAVSLGEPFKDNAYKLVAAIIEKDLVSGQGAP